MAKTGESSIQNTRNFLPTTVYDAEGNPISVDSDTEGNLRVTQGASDPQNPQAVTADNSVNQNDIDLARSSNGDFSPLAGYVGDGTVLDYFNSLTTVNCNTTTDNPKIIKVMFKRTLQLTKIGFGCDVITKGFGSSITLKILGSADEVRYSTTVDVTNSNSFVIEIPTLTSSQSANGIILEFNDTSEICLSNLIIVKSISTDSSIIIPTADGESKTPVTNNTPLPVTNQFGVPYDFTKQTSSAKTYLIQKGQLNHYRQRPAVLNEHIETARQIQHTITASSPICGQIFKASQDNINGISLTMESAGGTVFDDFESYANDTALQASWIATNPSDLATLETGIVYGGLQAMNLPGDATVGDEWYKAIPSTDYTDYLANFWLYQDYDYTTLKLRIYIEDSVGNSKSFPLVIQQDDVWENFQISEGSFTDDQATPMDTTDTVRVGFRLEDRRNNANFYVDYALAVPPAGKAKLKLWDMGPTLPVDGVTSIDDGTQYMEIGDKGLNSGAVVSELELNLIGGKRSYDIDRFIAGVALEIPGNTLLNVGNYYMITIEYVDVEVNVYGSNTSFNTNYYENGYAFSAPDESTPITKLGTYNDLAFMIFSTQDVWINTVSRTYNAIPGDESSESVYIEDKDMKIENVISNFSNPRQSIVAEFKDRYFYFPKGGKFEVNHNDDASDNTTQITVLIGYMFKPPIVNG